MTRKEWMKVHRPDLIDAECVGGVAGCPYEYSELTEIDASINMRSCVNYENCTDCWNASIIPNGEVDRKNDEIEFVKVERTEAEQTIKDSGNRREFSTGAVRDMAEGKGRCDLLPLTEVSFLIERTEIRSILTDINMFVRSGSEVCLLHAIREFADKYYTDRETAVLELAKHYEDGCKKYGERNWEKGIPVHCYIDSGIRHLLKFSRGDKDERHDRAFLWNMVGALWTMSNKPELMDIQRKTD